MPGNRWEKGGGGRRLSYSKLQSAAAADDDDDDDWEPYWQDGHYSLECAYIAADMRLSCS